MKLIALALLALTGCASTFGTWGLAAEKGDDPLEVARKEGHPNGAYEVSLHEYVWTWYSEGRVYKRAWFRWEPSTTTPKCGRMELIAMDYNWNNFMVSYDGR